MTGAPVYEMSEPLIMNAIKGDLLLVSGCSLVGVMVRALSPQEFFEHEGIMTSNGFDFSHGTTSEERYRDVDNFRREIFFPTGLDVWIDEQVLRIGWPGALHQSVFEGFEWHVRKDPECKDRILVNMSSDTAQCVGDSMTHPALVVRPDPAGVTLAQYQAAYDNIGRAADIARSIESHYRLFSFTEANIANDPGKNLPDPECGATGPIPENRATVSSTFVWAALKDAGVQLEGAVTESDPTGAPERAHAPDDGLYVYPEAERIKAAHASYDFIFNEAFAAIPEAPAASFLWSNIEEPDNQTVNCFAFDHCGKGAIQSATWEKPGDGRTVSPDSFKNLWDSVAQGGAYGHTETVFFRPSEYRRSYVYKSPLGNGTISGTVTLAGLPFEGANVYGDTSPVPIATSDSNGQFTMLNAPAGEYDVHASADIGPVGAREYFGANLPIHLDDGGTAFPQTGVAGDPIVLDLQGRPDTQRHVGMHGTARIFDDENWPVPDEDTTFPLTVDCKIEPDLATTGNDDRRLYLKWSQCGGGEVVVILDIACSLMPDDQTAAVGVYAHLYEGSSCEPDDPAGSKNVGHIIVPPGATGTFDFRVNNSNQSATGGDFAVLKFTVCNQKQGTEFSCNCEASPDGCLFGR